MADGIDTNYIARAAEEVAASLGAKESLSVGDFHIPFGPAGDTTKCIKGIAQQLGLPIGIELSYVPASWRPDGKERPGGHEKFESKHLVRTNWRGQGSEGIVAQVSIPPNLPLYGSSQLKNYPIKVRVSENCKSYPTTFIAVMAHELSHILLYSIGHRERDNETYTDITALLLGFSKITAQGRKVVKVTEGYNSTTTETTTYGYLSDENFDFATRKIAAIVESRKKEIRGAASAVRSCIQSHEGLRKELALVKQFLQRVDASPNVTGTTDVSKIILMHQASYFDKYESSARFSGEKLSGNEDYLTHLRHYTDTSAKRASAIEKEMKALRGIWAMQSKELKGDKLILARCLGFWTWILAKIS
ncbi:MAG: hypothetical protein HYZ75_11900 [Elusimicrobia bacterium]|nr:hypothetical protein [Elusimicrobiota bacterium]